MTIYKNISTCEFTYEVKATQMNPFNTMHGGEIVKIIDDVGGTCCHNWCNDRVSTATFHNIRMYQPIFTGDLLTVTATILYSGKTSLTPIIYVQKHNEGQGPVVAAVAYATFVRMQGDYQTESVPPLPIDSDYGRKMADRAKQIRDFSMMLDDSEEKN